MIDERNPDQDPVPEDPGPAPKPKKRKPRKPKALAPFTLRYRGKRYAADEYQVQDGYFSFTLANKKTYIPLAGPVEVTQNAVAGIQPAYTQTQVKAYGLYPVARPAPEAEDFQRKRNRELDSLMGVGTEFGHP